MEIQQITEDDLEPLAALYKQFWGEESSLDAMRGDFRQAAGEPGLPFSRREARLPTCRLCDGNHLRGAWLPVGKDEIINTALSGEARLARKSGKEANLIHIDRRTNGCNADKPAPDAPSGRKEDQTCGGR